LQHWAASLVRFLVRRLRTHQQARLFDDYVAALPRHGRADLARLHLNGRGGWLGAVGGLVGVYAGDIILSELASLHIDRLQPPDKAAYLLRWMPHLRDADLLRTFLALRIRSPRLKRLVRRLLGL
jgi:hypothetical protein